MTYAVSGLRSFYSLVVSIWQPWVCTIPGAHLLGSTALFKETFVHTVSAVDIIGLRCFWSDCVLLPGFNVQSDIFVVMIAWS